MGGTKPRGATTSGADFADILSTWERHHPRILRKDEDATAGTGVPQRHSLSPKRSPHEAVLDLHGKTRDETLAALDRFVGDCRGRGMRKILIVHGKGIHSGAEGVLQNTVREFIEGDPRLGAWGHPNAKDGGSGATWVVLKGGSRC